MILNPKTAAEKGWVRGSGMEVQQNGIDLTLDSVSQIEEGGIMAEGYTDTVTPLELSSDGAGYYELFPGTPYKILTNQWVKVPKDAAAFIHPRSTLNRMGSFCVAGVYDSGFENQIGFTLYCMAPIRLQKGVRIAQILFMVADAASQYRGRYHNPKTNGGN